MKRFRVPAALLLTAVTLCLSACNPADLKREYDKTRLLTTAQSKIYNLTAAGVSGFQCNVSLDWPGFFTSVNGEPLPPASITMRYLDASRLSFSTDLASNTTSKWTSPAQDTLPADRRAIINGLLDNTRKMLDGFLEAWVPTLNGHLLPVLNTSLTTTPNGYTVQNNVGEQKNQVSFDRDLRITHLETIEPSLHSELDSVFIPSPGGLLLTSLGGQTKTPADKEPVAIRMQTTYASVSGVELPQTLFITVPGMGLHMRFVGCTVKK